MGSHLFWIGDLNYRISLPGDEIRAEVAKGLEDALKLLDGDQLRAQQQEKKAFVGFKEQEIKFLPSYKFDVGTDDYDTSEKKRAPSWCDRILWFQNPLHKDSTWLKPIYYGNTFEIKISDHKPVMAIFGAKVRFCLKYI